MTFSVIGTDTTTNNPVHIPQSSRRQGLYIVAVTGQEKTGLIENLIITKGRCLRCKPHSFPLHPRLRNHLG